MQDSDNRLADAQREQESGNLDAAAALYRQILQQDPTQVEALFHLGTLELQRSNLPLGIEMLQTAAALLPEVPQVHNNLGIAYKLAGRFTEASAAFEQALQLDPQQSATYFNLADLAADLKQFDAAVSLYRHSLSLAPREAGTWLKLGELLYAHGNWEGTEQCLREVLDLGMFIAQPAKELELQCQLGLVQLKQDKLSEAADTFQAMLQVDPHLAEIQANLAYVYERQGKITAAVAAGRQAVAIKPRLAEAHNNLGVALRSQHQLVEARNCFKRAAELAPNYALAHFNAGAASLHLGEYVAGWQGYEWRNATLSTPPRSFVEPAWDGSSLAGKTLLLHTEQGFGDAIQFSRFIPLARERSQAKIVVEGPAALLPLLTKLAGVDACVVAGSPLPEFHARLAIPSLPGVLGIEVMDLPATPIPYLAAPTDRLSAWRERLRVLGGPAAETKLKIGIVWQGNPDQMQDYVRSCPTKQFARLVESRDAVWFSLQKAAETVKPEQRELPASCVIPLGDELRDFADTAAALSALDLLITVDTSVAHLAGALGIPTWTLLCHTPDWRWQLTGSDCPWYPTMRLFRQPAWGNWESVIVQVASALQNNTAAAA